MIDILKQMLFSLEQYRKEQDKLIEQLTEILKAHGVEVSKEEIEKAEKEKEGTKQQKAEAR